MSSHPQFNPAYSSTLGLLPFLQSGNTAPKPVVIEDPIPNFDSAALRLSPKDIQAKGGNNKLGQKREPLFSAFPKPQQFLDRTKNLSKNVLNAPLQLKMDGNATFDDFIKLGVDGFEIPYYSFDTPYTTNAFSDFINTVSLGSYVVGTPNYFAEAEFWDSVPLIQGFDGNEYDKDLITKPFSEVGRPVGLSDEEFAALVEQKTSDTANGTSQSGTSSNGTLNTSLLRGAIENANGDSISVSKELLLALVDEAESGSSDEEKIDYQTKKLQKGLSSSYGIKNAMSDGGAGLYQSITNLSGINNLDNITAETSASTGSSASSSKSSASNFLGLSGQQASMLSDTMSWAKEITSGKAATPTSAAIPQASPSLLGSAASPFSNPATINPAQQLFPYLAPSTPLPPPAQGMPPMSMSGYGLNASQSSILSDSFNFAKQYQMAGIGGTSLLGGNAAGGMGLGSLGAYGASMPSFGSNPYGASPLPISNAYSAPSNYGGSYGAGMPGYAAVAAAAVVMPGLTPPPPPPSNYGGGYGNPAQPSYSAGNSSQAIIHQIGSILQQFMGLLGELSSRLPY